MKKLLVILLVAAALAGAGFYSYKIYVERASGEDVYASFVMEAYDKIQENYWAGNVASSTERINTLAQVKEELGRATSTATKKETALNIVIATLSNLEPKGRNGLLSDKQEKEFRDVVNNKNPETGEVEPTVESRVAGKTLYLGVKQIAPTTLQEIGNALTKASTTPGMDSIIFDFRGNIGGSLDFLPAFLGLFIGPDQYAFDLFSHGEKKVIRTTMPKYPDFERYKEIAFFSDNATQSTAELTIDAFKKYRLAKSVGVTTKGWGTIENTYPLATEIDPETKYLLLLVNNLTVRADNEPIEGNGVVPDVDTSKVGWQSELPKVFKSASLINALKVFVK